MTIDFFLNGRPERIDIDPMTRLLDVLRTVYELTGTKEGCGEGECGACSVLIDGQIANSCLVVMGNVAGRSVQTVESVRETAHGRQIIEAMNAAGGVQCGFCTPGFVVAGAALLERHPSPNAEDITDALSGNICRCTGYQMIFEALQTVGSGPTEAREVTAAGAPAATVRAPEISLQRALDRLALGGTRVVAGGTDLVVRHRRGAQVPVDIGAAPLFVQHIPHLRTLASDAEGGFHIGAAVTLNKLATLPNRPTVLDTVLREFASPGVRSSATIGGNICNASPAGDLLPALYAHEARIEIASKAGTRVVPIDQFIVGPGRTALEPGELVTAVQIGDTGADYRFYQKVAARLSNALSKLSVYAFARTKNGRINTIAIAVGAVAPTVVRLPGVEATLIGATADELAAERAGSAAAIALQRYAEAIRPITDQRSNANYRAATALRLIRHVLTVDLPRHMRA